MIEPKDIRIGSYFNVPNPNQCPFRIDCIEFYHPKDNFGKFGMFQKGFENAPPLTWYLKDLEPIPLTEEWLINLGVEYAKAYDGVYRYSKSGIHIYGCNTFKGEEFGFKSGEIDIEINHVHQLINMFYSLTGQELEILKSA